MHASFEKHQLKFKKPATTSRGSMENHEVFYLTLEQNKLKGIGEIAPLPGLSVEHTEQLEAQITLFCQLINEGIPIHEFISDFGPSFRFGFESAHLDLNHGGRNILFPSDFTRGDFSIPINGLVWMSEIEAMQAEAFEKIKSGYKVIKFKVGALDFDSECRLLETIRKKHSEWQITFRLDANGGLDPSFWEEQLRAFSKYYIHSIEQPLKPGPASIWDEVCAKSPIKIAFDETLIGMKPDEETEKYMKLVKPDFFILKPTLLGGFKICDSWIALGKRCQIDWWATSALESNIGLNAIAQWAASYKPAIEQGLGTGQLYINNRPSSLDLNPPFLNYLEKARI